jgi:hypothetical protein
MIVCNSTTFQNAIQPIKIRKATRVGPSLVADIELRDIASEGLLR